MAGCSCRLALQRSLAPAEFMPPVPAARVILVARCTERVTLLVTVLQERGQQEAAAAGSGSRSLQGSAGGKAVPPPPRRKFLSRKAQEQALLVSALTQVCLIVQLVNPRLICTAAAPAAGLQPQCSAAAWPLCSAS